MITLIQLTPGDYRAEHLAGMAAEHGAELRRVQRDQGVPGQRLLIVMQGERSLIREWERRIVVLRSRFLVATEAGRRDFEHHVELRSSPERVAGMVELAEIAEAHGAGLCRDPRRLVVQRCLGASRAEAAERRDLLLADLRAAGHEVVAVESWHIRHDSNAALDAGWLAPPVRQSSRGANLINGVRRRFPETFRPVPGRGVKQRLVFDPALKEHENAYRAGEPEFTDAEVGHRWRSAREDAMSRLLTVLAGSRWAGHLVLRGSSVMPAWVGTAARPPGDLDFVVTGLEAAVAGHRQLPAGQGPVRRGPARRAHLGRSRPGPRADAARAGRRGGRAHRGDAAELAAGGLGELHRGVPGCAGDVAALAAAAGSGARPGVERARG